MKFNVYHQKVCCTLEIRQHFKTLFYRYRRLKLSQKCASHSKTMLLFCFLKSQDMSSDKELNQIGLECNPFINNIPDWAVDLQNYVDESMIWCCYLKVFKSKDCMRTRYDSPQIKFIPVCLHWELVPLYW